MEVYLLLGFAIALYWVVFSKFYDLITKAE